MTVSECETQGRGLSAEPQSEPCTPSLVPVSNMNGALYGVATGAFSVIGPMCGRIELEGHTTGVAGRAGV